MIIAGVDPGIQNTGIAVLKVEKTFKEIITFDNIKTKQSDQFQNRLKVIYDKLRKYFKHNNPDVVALEEIFYSRNVKIALKMGHARGITLLAAANFQIPVKEYSPREIKLSVTGNGNASKHQVQQMICRILNMNSIPSSYDITDAMAVAYCCSQRLISI